MFLLLFIIYFYLFFDRSTTGKFEMSARYRSESENF